MELLGIQIKELVKMEVDLSEFTAAGEPLVVEVRELTAEDDLYIYDAIKALDLQNEYKVVLAARIMAATYSTEGKRVFGVKEINKVLSLPPKMFGKLFTAQSELNPIESLDSKKKQS